MKKEKRFPRIKFSPKAFQDAWSKLDSYLNDEQRKKIHLTIQVELANEEWEYESEAEFFADYTKDTKSAFYTKSADNFNYQIRVFYYRPNTKVSITAPKRSVIEEIHQIFDKYAPECTLPEEIKPSEEEPIIFIGHGQSNQWRDLKDHLQDKHGYNIEAYEIGARAGHAIRDILEEMLSKSSFALLVMTGEDKDDKGKLRARDNVIHELGLFQGKLGFSRAIILLEEGTQEFSNIHGIQQIRYSKNNIKETFGEIIATLKREFDKNNS
jgi:predicted nucleotide-binding protein